MLSTPAIYRPRNQAAIGLRVGLLLLIVSTSMSVSGCKGRSIKEENPVFAPAPPRRSLVNQSADAEEQKLAMLDSEDGVQPAGFSSKRKEGPLTGTTVVAEVNGKPIFVDDVLNGARQVLENDPQLDVKRREMIIEATIRKRLPKYVEDEIVVQALELKIPEEKRNDLKESLEPQFQKIIEKIKEKEGFTTDRELNEKLAGEGMTIALLRDTFVRQQMVDGYVGSLVKVPKTIDREILVKYYQDHIADYTSEDEVRFAEIVVRFRDHGGREGAEKVMTTVVTQLQNDVEFGDVALAMSDTLTSRKRGEVGWIKRGSLSDKALEELLFEMPDKSTSSVQVRDDRFEVYKVIDHRHSGTTPFQELQKEIERTIIDQMEEEARTKVRQEIRDQAHVVTIYGDVLSNMDGNPGRQPQANPGRSQGI